MSTIIENPSLQDTRRGWLVLFLTNLFSGMVACTVEIVVLLLDKTSAQKLGAIWPVSLIIGACSLTLTYLLFHHTYRRNGTKIAQSVQVIGYISLIMMLGGVVISMWTTLKSSSKDDVTIATAMLRNLTLSVPFVYFLVYNRRLIRSNRQLLSKGLTEISVENSKEQRVIH